MGWSARLSIDELGAVGRDDIAAPGPVGARLRATECTEAIATVARKRAPTQSRAYGWSARLSIDELRDMTLPRWDR
jgi:hypothetical protein